MPQEGMFLAVSIKWIKNLKKKQKKTDEVEFKCNTSRVRLFGC